MTDENTTEELNARPGKPRSRGMINPDQIQMIPRHVGRIERLRLAIDKATANENPEKVASLQEELDRRLAELAQARTLLDSI